MRITGLLTGSTNISNRSCTESCYTRLWSRHFSTCFLRLICSSRANMCDEPADIAALCPHLIISLYPWPTSRCCYNTRERESKQTSRFADMPEETRSECRNKQGRIARIQYQYSKQSSAEGWIITNSCWPLCDISECYSITTHVFRRSGDGQS